MSIAPAIASGLKPEIGLFTAIIGGFLAFSALGGSRVQIGGPAGAFVALPRAHCHEARTRGSSSFAPSWRGFILFLLGACKLGSLIKYIPFPVVTGFTSGIAIVIMSTQIRDFFGLSQKLPPDFIVAKCVR